MKTALSLDHLTEKASRDFLAALAPNFDVAGAILFGSRARGTHRPDSDADIAVLLRGCRRRLLPVKLAMADLAFDVMLETGIDISPLPVWLEDWEHPQSHPNPDLLHRIKAEGVVLS